ncbi:MAG: DUF4235 domain-containing protein [Actinomycetota bacterium]|nr:DUF4235 domain-containing protein [Actinomycetota bacterium]
MSEQPSSQSAPAREPAVAGGDGLADEVAAVEMAREQLGDDLDRLNEEVRAQMGETLENTAWKLAVTVSAVVAGIVMRKTVSAAWKGLRKEEPPSNPADRNTGWPEALAWAAASGLAVGIARLLATRGAAAGWERYTGVVPPGLADGRA